MSRTLMPNNLTSPHVLNLYPSQNSWIFESAAIASYIDLIYTDQPRLHDPSEGEDGSALEQARVKQWSSFASDYVFNTLEHHLIKPSVTLLQKNKNPNASREEQEEVRVLQKYVQDGYDKSREVLQVIEDHLEKQQQGGGHFLLGKKVSWADLYLAPVIADFHAVSLGRGLLEEFPHLKKWFFEFSKQDCFLKTYPGSLSQVLLEAAN